MIIGLLINISNISPLAAAIICILLGCTVYINNIGRVKNQLYLFLSVILTIWAYACFIQSITTDPKMAILYDIILYDVAAFAPTIFLHFISVFTNIKRKVMLTFGYVISCLIIILNNSHYFRDGVVFLFNNRFVTVPKIGWYIYIIFFAFVVLIAFYDLLITIVRSSGETKNNSKYMLIASISLVMGGICYFILILRIATFPIDSILNLSSSILLSVFQIIISYAILRYHLMDINIVIRKSIIYSIIGAFIGLLYLLLLRCSNLLIVDGQVQPALRLIYQVFSFIAFNLHVFLGLFVLFNNPKRMVNRVFFLLSIFISIWIACCFMQIMTLDINIALLADLILRKAAVFTPALFLHTFYEIVGVKDARLVIMSYVVCVFLFILSFFNIFASGVNYAYGARYLTQPGPLYFLLPLLIVISALLALRQILLARNKAIGYRKIQLDYLLISGAVVISAALFYFLLVYNIIFTPFDNMFNIIYGITMAYAILKHRIMDITIVLRKGLVYSTLVGLVAGIYLTLIYLLGNLMGGFGAARVAVGSIASIFLFAIIFQPLRDKIQDLIDKIFFRGKYDYQKTIKELSLAARTIAGINELLDRILSAIVDVIKTKNAAVFVIERRTGQYILRKSLGATPGRKTFTNADLIIQKLLNKKEVIICGINGNDMIELDATVIFPIFAKNELVGFMCLDDKLSGEVYSDDDIDLLSTLCNQMGVSIENAMLYEDAMEAQKQLYQADKLATLGTLAAGLAHEIKNPIAAIKGFAQVIGKAIEEKDSEVIEDFKMVVPRQLDRINEIVEKFLSLSKPSKLAKEKVNINILLDEIIKLVDKQAMKQRIEIIKQFGDLPELLADPGQLTQAFLNLILNGIQSMPNGGTIEIRTNEGIIKDNIKLIIIEIKDNGMGIPKDKLSKIFDPFYTTKEHGSGLGLAVTKKIIDDHHGEIKVLSEEGKGTAFTVVLPLSA